METSEGLHPLLLLLLFLIAVWVAKLVLLALRPGAWRQVADQTAADTLRGCVTLLFWLALLCALFYFA